MFLDLFDRDHPERIRAKRTTGTEEHCRVSHELETVLNGSDSHRVDLFWREAFACHEPLRLLDAARRRSAGVQSHLLDLEVYQ